MSVEPIDFKDVKAVKTESIPDEVFLAFNELIVKNFNGVSSTIKVNALIDNIIGKFHENNRICKREMIFDGNWLDVEDSYSKKGWCVEWDSPAYCENYEAYFKFEQLRT